MPAFFRWQYNGTFDTSSPDFPIRLDADTMVVHAAAGLSLRLLLEFLAQARLVTCTSSCEVLQNHCALAPGPRISMLPHFTGQCEHEQPLSRICPMGQGSTLAGPFAWRQLCHSEAFCSPSPIL